MAIKGQQIGTALLDALGLTGNIRAIELRCAVNELVVIKCEMLLIDEIDKDQFKTVFKTYELTERKEPETC